MNSKAKWTLVACASLACISCAVLSPHRVSRIGPTLAPRPENCSIEVLEEGTLPVRPYRDVGIVELKNCPDYRSGSCRKWLRKAACELGGEVVYRDRSPRPEYELNQVIYKLTVAAYISSLRDAEEASDSSDCDAAEDASKENQTEEPPERCLE